MLIFLSGINFTAFAQVDLYIRDNVGDNGTEPNPSTGTYYTSPDIWIRKEPIAGYSPNPFPVASPPAWIASNPNEPAEYRDASQYSRPNWIYVKVTNRGSVTSTGNEVLKVYWAKASTGLNWPNQWVDYVTTWGSCTAKLFGQEVTKPRSNFAYMSAADRTSYKNAVLALDAQFYGDGVSWWDKQDEIHDGTHVHHTEAFLPWHRELVNRYELLLREIDPLVRLGYWDWTTDPRTTNSVNMFSTSAPLFMGTDYGLVCTPFSCYSPGPPVVNSFSTPADIYRYMTSGTPVPCTGTNCQNGFASGVYSDADNIIYGNTLSQVNQWPAFCNNLEGNALGFNHNYIHSYIGGTMGNPHTSFQDPFAYVLHSNVDRLFAKWQRDPNYIYRLRTADVYGVDAGVSPISDDIEPWAGTSVLPQYPVYPWTTAGGQIQVKNCQDESVVSPPIYDNVLCTVPKLAPGESCVMQVQWYPPNPAAYACFGADLGHFCLLARIVASNDPMYATETTSVAYNAQQNNNVAWKNISVVDNLPGAGIIGHVIIRNVLKAKQAVRLTFNETSLFAHNGYVKINLGDALFNEWHNGGNVGANVEVGEGTNQIILTSPNAWIGNITMQGNEFENIDADFNNITVDNGDGTEVYEMNIEQNNELATGGVEFIGGEDFQVALANHDPGILVPTASVQTPEQYFSSHTYVYPNPATTNLTIMVKDNYVTTYKLRIIDVSGRTVYQTTFGDTYVLDIEKYSNGVYQAEITDTKTTHKVVKNFTVAR